MKDCYWQLEACFDFCYTGSSVAHFANPSLKWPEHTPHISFVIFGRKMGHVPQSAEKGLSFSLGKSGLFSKITLSSFCLKTGSANASLLINVMGLHLKTKGLFKLVPPLPPLSPFLSLISQRHAWAYSFRTMNLIFSAVFISQQWDLFFLQTPPQACSNNEQLYSTHNQGSFDSSM